MTKFKKGDVPNPKGINGGGHAPLKYTEEVVVDIANRLIKWMDKAEDNIFVKEFAVENRYSNSDFDDWARKYTSFRLIYTQAKQKQEIKLLKGGLKGKYKEQMTKFVLVNHHDYKEKHEANVNQTGNVTVQVVDYSRSK